MGAAAILGLLAVWVAFPLRLYLHRHQAAIALPDRPSPRDAAEARRQDLDDLRLLPDYDRSFSAAAFSAFLGGIDALRSRADGLSLPEFEMEVSRLVALAGNAHTTVSKTQRVAVFGRAPVRLAWFADGLYVVRATGPATELLGRRVVSIDGRLADDALAAVQPYLSGTAERARDDSPPLFECPALLRVIWPDTDGVHLALAFADGSNATLAALPPAPDRFDIQPVRAIMDYPAEGWATELSRTPAVPLSLREPGRMAFAVDLGDGGAYIRINGNEDDAAGPLAEQLTRIADMAPKGGWRRIVLDLRFNEGGDELKTMDFTARLPGLLTADGGLWIVTGNATFSAAIIAAARAKVFVGARAHIVGERVGDRNPFWTGGGAPLVLRNSGIAIAHGYFKQDWESGCRAVDVCSPLQFAFGVAAGDLSPEVEVGWSFADYAAGRDTVLERVVALSR